MAWGPDILSLVGGDGVRSLNLRNNLRVKSEKKVSKKSQKSCTLVVGEIKVSKISKCQKMCTLVVGQINKK